MIQPDDETPVFIKRVSANEDLGRSISLAETTAVVKNGFISREQASYCLGWNKLVNPNSESQVVLYNAIGPDLATVLLTTNATTIYGVDANPPSFGKTRYYLTAWDMVDTDIVSLPPIDRYNEDGISVLTNEAAAKKLRETLRLRAVRGYWDLGEMATWSIDRCLIIELKKLGIKPNEIQIDNVNERLQLDFRWAFPGERPKPRKVTYIKGFTFDIVDKPGEYNLLPLDGYYEKSVEAGRFDETPEKDLRVLMEYIKPGGFVLIGRSIGTDDQLKQHEESGRAALGNAFKPLEISETYRTIVHQKLQGEHASRYGWDLYGAMKLK